MSTEDGDEKICYMYSPSAAGAGRSPRIVDISVVASALPRLEHLPWIDIFRGSGVCFDNIFWLLLHGFFFSFALWFRVYVSFSTSTCQVFLRVFFFYCACVYMYTTRWHIPTRGIPINKQIGKCWRKKNSNKRNSLYKRNWHLFRPRPQLLSHIWHPFVTPVTAPVLCKTTQSWYTYERKGRDLIILAADSGFYFGPCAMRFIESRLHDVLLGKTRNFIIPALSDFIVVAPWHAASSSHRRRSPGLRLRPEPS